MNPAPPQPLLWLLKCICSNKGSSRGSHCRVNKVWTGAWMPINISSPPLVIAANSGLRLKAAYFWSTCLLFWSEILLIIYNLSLSRNLDSTAVSSQLPTFRLSPPNIHLITASSPGWPTYVCCRSVGDLCLCLSLSQIACSLLQR